MVDLAKTLSSVKSTPPMPTVPVAVIMPVGIEAAVGDVVVSAVVLTKDLDSKVTLNSIRHGIAMRLTLVHTASGTTMAEFQMRANNTEGTFTYKPGGLVVRADSLLGPLFDKYMDLPDFATAVGFCPRSEDDMRRRLQVAAKNLTHLVRDKYPDCYMHVDPKMFDFKLEDLWANGVPTFPSTPIIVTDEAEQTMSEADRMRIFFGYTTAEALAVSVRSARIMDQDEMYPALKLAANRGYGCPELYRGLRKMEGFEVKGVRQVLTERWMKWAVSNLDLPKFVKATSTKPEDADVPTTPGQVYTDSQGRKAMPFDRKSAVKMSDELNEEMEKGTKRVMRLRNWTRTFLPSINKQLKDGKALSGRQMYVLHEVYNGNMI